MRVSPCALLANSDQEAMNLAQLQSEATHNHPSAIHAAKALVIAIRLANRGVAKEQIRNVMMNIFGYDLTKNLTELKEETGGKFESSAGGTLRLALTAVLEAYTFEEAIRNCIDLGGDTDTTAAAAGGLAEILYQIPTEITQSCEALLDEEMKSLLEQEYSDSRACYTLSENALKEDFLVYTPLFNEENKQYLTGNAKYQLSLAK